MNVLPDSLSHIPVKYSSVAESLAGATDCGVLWQGVPGRLLLHLPQVARYLIENGSSITIEPAAAADPDAVAYYFKMTPLAALLYQRGSLVFHAAAVCKGDDAYLIAGDSGAGKSTLLALLLQRGWNMLADDLAPVTLQSDGTFMVSSVSSSIPLWQETAEILGLHGTSEKTYDRARVHLPGEPAAVGGKKLKSVVWFGVHSGRSVVLNAQEGVAWLRCAPALLYNSHVADCLCDRVVYLKSMAALAGAIPLHRLMRPRGVWSIDSVLDSFEKLKV